MAELHSTDAFTDLVLHLLAHVSATGPEDLFEPRYVAWADSLTPPDLRARLHEDADVLAHRWSSHDGHALQAWPELFSTWSAFAATRARPLAELRADEVARPDVLARLQACAPAIVELVHAQLALLAPWFATLHAEVIAPALAERRAAVASALADAIELVPTLADERVELAWSLGPRGRGLTHRIVVGAPACWNGLGPHTPAVLALHEHAVRRASASDWARAEWQALRELAVAMAGAPAPLARAHADWLATLELRGLVELLRANQAIEPALATRLLAEPHVRAQWLARD